ncbi:(ZYRO0A07084g) [Zygosaccharomyces parabailii]|nr:(ZYRO0A07084g) [Zygosaccharomyces parabailii]CDH13014.1 related to dehydrogenase [Zygosaccharomyces bailii ISA1307]
MNLLGRRVGLTTLYKFATRSLSTEYSHAVIGAGVVGLAIAAELSKVESNNILLLEKNDRFGLETSSHNSEVIHAGLYYPQNSLKSRLCIEGKNIIYQELDPLKTGVNWIKCGKWIVAQTDYEDSFVEELYHTCKEKLGIDVEILTSAEAKRKEKFIRVERSALSSPTTGIIDSHSLMEYLLSIIETNDGEVVYGAEVMDLRYNLGNGYSVMVRDHFGDSEELMDMAVDNVVNAAGLSADKVCNMLLPQERKMKQYYAKGNYYKMSSGGFPGVHRLIYPVPPKDGKSLGTHLTIDMNYEIKFGPDLEYVDSPTDYSVNEANIPSAYEAISTYYPYLEPEDLEAAYSGIRPKVAGPKDKSFKDFYIKEEEGFPGFVNLLGIESPGLTSSLAIGKYVRNIYHGK